MPVRQFRCGDELWALVCAQADAQGLSTAQYVREAITMRAVWQLARSDGPMPAAFEEVGHILIEEAGLRGLL